MHLYLIRHAQSANNDLYTRTGAAVGRHVDPPLTEIGHRQAQLLAHFLAAPPREREAGAPPLVGNYVARHDRHGFGLTHLYCSLMTRSIQTAGYVAAATGLPLVGWTEIHERGGLHNVDEATGDDLGIPGPGRAWFAAEYPHLMLPDTLDDAGWWNRPPESNAEAVPRARVVWSQLLERHGNTDNRVAMISHAGFFQSLLTALFSADENLAAPILGIDQMGFGMSNVSISRFEIGDGLIVLRYLNRVEFLPDELITG
jgi:2,3-bisphosphoglycerate-dependent phosphoglycerate mutase